MNTDLNDATLSTIVKHIREEYPSKKHFSAAFIAEHFNKKISVIRRRVGTKNLEPTAYFKDSLLLRLNKINIDTLDETTLDRDQKIAYIVDSFVKILPTDVSRNYIEKYYFESIAIITKRVSYRSRITPTFIVDRILQVQELHEIILTERDAFEELTKTKKVLRYIFRIESDKEYDEGFTDDELEKIFIVMPEHKTYQNEPFVLSSYQAIIFYIDNANKLITSPQYLAPFFKDDFVNGKCKLPLSTFLPAFRKAEVEYPAQFVAVEIILRYTNRKIYKVRYGVRK